LIIPYQNAALSCNEVIELEKCIPKHWTKNCQYRGFQPIKTAQKWGSYSSK